MLCPCRLKQGLTQDQQAVLRPDLKTPFTSHEDLIKRLTPYHVCYDPSLTPADVKKGWCCVDNWFLQSIPDIRGQGCFFHDAIFVACATTKVKKVWNCQQRKLLTASATYSNVCIHHRQNFLPRKNSIFYLLTEFLRKKILPVLGANIATSRGCG